MPFDRLIRTVDRWAADHPQVAFHAQIGPNAWKPPHVPWTELLKPDAYRGYFEKATSIIAHAGIGSILTALEFGKPILILPRRAALLETRNDHQLATARQFSHMSGVESAFTENEVWDRLQKNERLGPPDRCVHHADPRLIESLQRFIRGH